jgi:hypothetical protein
VFGRSLFEIIKTKLSPDSSSLNNLIIDFQIPHRNLDLRIFDIELNQLTKNEIIIYRPLKYIFVNVRFGSVSNSCSLRKT